MKDVEDADVAVTAAEPLGQAARAEVARLSLAVRTARREAERREREVADLDDLGRNAEAYLEQSLSELIEDRRRECERDLAEEEAVADRVVAAARQEAARDAARALQEAAERGDAAREDAAREDARRRVEDERDRSAPPTPQLRLRVVGAEDLAEAVHHPAFARPVTDEAPERTPAVEPALSTALPEGGLGAGMALVPIDELRTLVQAAVVVGLREAVAQAAATMQVVPALARPSAPNVQGAKEPSLEVVDEPPLGRRFLHLDVLLPLVAALIVIVLFFAWIG